MADVPDQPIARSIEGVVDCGGQFDHPEARAEMSSRHRHRVDGLLAQLVRDLPDLLQLELAQVGGGADGIQKRGLTEISHCGIPILYVREPQTEIGQRRRRATDVPRVAKLQALTCLKFG